MREVDTSGGRSHAVLVATVLCLGLGVAAAEAAPAVNEAGGPAEAAVEPAAETGWDRARDFRPVVRYLSEGRARAAAQALAEPSGEATPKEATVGEVEVAGWLWRRVAEVAIAEEAIPTARLALEHVPVGVGVGDLPLQLARLRATAGDSAGALAMLEEIDTLPASSRPEALALSADLFEALGEREAARARWRHLLFEHPGHPSAREAYGRFLDLSEAGDPMPGPEDWLARLERLLAAHHNDEAIASAERLRELLPGDHPLDCRIGLALGSAHRKARNYQEAIETLEPVVADCDDEVISVEALWTLASATWILEGDPAIPLYERFAAQWPTHEDADRALYLVAALHHRESRLDAARSVLESQLARFPAGNQRAGASWRRFWIDFQDGRAEAGLPFLQAVLEDEGLGGGTFHGERARYWQARVLAAEGREDEAAKILQGLIEDHPLSYYWLMAWQRLQALSSERAGRLAGGFPVPEDLPERAAPSAASPAAHSLADLPETWAGRRLLDLGLPDLAAAALRRAEAAAADRGPDALVELALLLDAAGDAHRAHWVIRTRARGFDDRWPEGAHTRVWRAAYPRAYRKEVEAAAAEAGIDPLLLHAITREESALMPGAVSWAGAVGLAQMMPRTAADVAGRIGLDPSTIDRTSLVDPALNLRIAARHLADLLDLFQGHPALAIAAYNAGERTVMGWVLDAHDSDLDAFIESIRIAETQRYTRRVLRSWATYRWLYGPPHDRLLSLPLGVRLE